MPTTEAALSDLWLILDTTRAPFKARYRSRRPSPDNVQLSKVRNRDMRGVIGDCRSERRGERAGAAIQPNETRERVGAFEMIALRRLSVEDRQTRTSDNPAFRGGLFGRCSRLA